MPYAVKEIIYTLQGEGANAGRPAVFCRFAGCNLWSGRAANRPAAICTFCDTNFVGTDGPGGGKFASAGELAAAITSAWPASDANHPNGFVVCTGGEPLLQLDTQAIKALQARGFQVAIETNGTIACPTEVDWICVSPKARTRLEVRQGNELKLVYPQEGADPEQYQALDFSHHFLQPMDGPEQGKNTQLALEYCLKHPRWRLSLQLHKFLQIP